MHMSDVINHLNWRYATKKFDPAKKLDEDKLNRILEAIRLAPTSSGLQPFEVFVVKNPNCAPRSAKWAGTRRSDRSVAPAGVRGLGQHHAGRID
jgi:nitroreductase